MATIGRGIGRGRRRGPAPARRRLAAARTRRSLAARQQNKISEERMAELKEQLGPPPKTAEKATTLAPGEVITKEAVLAGKVEGAGINPPKRQAILQLQLSGLPETQARGIADTAFRQSSGPPLPTTFSEDVSPVAQSMVAKLESGEPLTQREYELRQRDIKVAQLTAVAERVRAGDTTGVVFEPTKGEQALKVFKRSIKKVTDKDTLKERLPGETLVKQQFKDAILKTKTKLAVSTLGLIKREKAVAKKKSELKTEQFVSQLTPRELKRIGFGIDTVVRKEAQVKDLFKDTGKHIKKEFKITNIKVSEKIGITDISGTADRAKEATISSIKKFEKVDKVLSGKEGITFFGKEINAKKTGRFIGGFVEQSLTQIKYQPLQTTGKFAAGVAISLVAPHTLGALPKVLGKGISLVGSVSFVGAKAAEFALTPGAKRKGALLAKDLPFYAGLATPRFIRGGIAIGKQVKFPQFSTVKVHGPKEVTPPARPIGEFLKRRKVQVYCPTPK